VSSTTASQSSDVGRLLRDLTPQVLAAVAKRYGDFDAAEDAVQESLIAATQQWPAEGVPNNPRGWLYHVAVRRLTDAARSEVARQRREEMVATEMSSTEVVIPAMLGDMSAEEDDSLVLVFMCCHPALTTSSAIALTLRAVGGLTTAEIANAFLTPEATMAQRISRAKQTIKNSKTPFSMPSDAERADRLAAVLHVLYLIFSEGYTSSVGDALNRPDLSNEAIRLARMLHAGLPTDGEVTGLLALMLLTDARRAARTGPQGELIPLDEQDRTKWDQTLIAEGTSLVSAAFSGAVIGYYQLQAAIAALHDAAPTAEATDWRQVLGLYTTLEAIAKSPMVQLNRAIAVAMVEGPASGLELVDALYVDGALKGHYRLDAVRGHFYEMSGDAKRAVESFRLAALRTASTPERNYLEMKAATLAAKRK
jgi:RNA polymerase sigma factor (sigma-70 family)